MKQVLQPGQQVVRCDETNATLFRPDPDGVGVWTWCRGHHREELHTWGRLGLTREIAERFLREMVIELSTYRVMITATESGEVVSSRLQKLDGFVVSGGLPFEDWVDVCDDVGVKIEDDGSVILFKPEQQVNNI